MKILVFAAILSGGLLISSCSSESVSTVNSAPAANSAVNKTTADKPTDTAKADDVPANIKAAIPTAQTFAKQHKDLSDEQIASIEKDTGGKLTEKDHHSYLAFSTANGAKTQVGAATVVKAGGKEIVIVYANKEGSPVIKEIIADGLPAGFLSQFAGKGHDDDLLLGVDIKANGVKEDEAKAITNAIRIDVLSMQTLYGTAHSH